MKQTNNYKLQVGKTYLATDTNTVFVASQSDVHGAWLAKSEHLYKEVEPVTPVNEGQQQPVQGEGFTPGEWVLAPTLYRENKELKEQLQREYKRSDSYLKSWEKQAEQVRVLREALAGFEAVLLEGDPGKISDYWFSVKHLTETK